MQLYPLPHKNSRDPNTSQQDTVMINDLQSN